MIPKKLHFTYSQKDLPLIYKENLERWKAVYPDWDIQLYNRETTLSFFRAHFPEYVEDVKKISIGAVVADLFRYGILYIHGGFYADIDTVPLQRIPKDWLSFQSVIGYEFLRAHDLKTTWYTKDIYCIWALLSAPGVPLYKESLERSIDHLRKKRFSLKTPRDVVESTGPIHFTNVVEKHLEFPGLHIVDIEVFGSRPGKIPQTEKSVIQHQFHGEHGWLIEVQAPQIRVYE